jgi:hypothetical protein
MKTRVTKFVVVYACVMFVTSVTLVSKHQWPYANGALIGTAVLIGLVWRNPRSFPDTRKSPGQRSPAGLRVIVAINLAVAVLFVFVSYPLKTTFITIVAIALATLNVGVTLTAVVAVSQRFRNESSAPHSID